VTLAFPGTGAAEISASVVASCEDRDLAFLTIDDESVLGVALRTVAKGNSDECVPKTPCVALGYPLGLPRPSTDAGVISGVQVLQGHTLLQQDAANDPGNSGGPLEITAPDESPVVVGVNSAMMKNSNGMGYAVPINFVGFGHSRSRGRLGVADDGGLDDGDFSVGSPEPGQARRPPGAGVQDCSPVGVCWRPNRRGLRHLLHGLPGLDLVRHDVRARFLHGVYQPVVSRASRGLGHRPNVPALPRALLRVQFFCQTGAIELTYLASANVRRLGCLCGGWRRKILRRTKRKYRHENSL